jgi:hypothetical protein
MRSVKEGFRSDPEIARTFFFAMATPFRFQRADASQLLPRRLDDCGDPGLVIRSAMVHFAVIPSAALRP